MIAAVKGHREFRTSFFPPESTSQGDDNHQTYQRGEADNIVLRVGCRPHVDACNKVDLLPYLDCSLEDIRREAVKVNPDITLFEVSTKTGEGLEGWFDWLRGRVKKA